MFGAIARFFKTLGRWIVNLISYTGLAIVVASTLYTLYLIFMFFYADTNIWFTLIMVTAAAPITIPLVPIYMGMVYGDWLALKIFLGGLMVGVFLALPKIKEFIESRR